MAVWVGQTVCRPCSAYHLARAGSSTRTTTRSTPKRRLAICAITRLVLSPSVEATNASACSMPASSSASISSAVPTVKRPPESSQLSSRPRLRSAIASGSSSRTETSLPSASICLEIADPTRPQPTTSTNTQPTLHRVRPGNAHRRLGLDPLAEPVAVGGRGGEDDLAGCLVDHVAGGLSHEPVAGPAATSEAGSAAGPGGLLSGQDDGLHPAPLGLRDDRR